MMTEDKLSYLFYSDEHLSCLNYKTSIDFGFKHIELKAGQTLKNEMMPRHNIIMQIKGVTSILCNDYPECTLKEGEMILIHRSTQFEATVIEDSDCVIFGFEVPLSNCDKLSLESYSTICDEIRYDFEPTEIKQSLKMFLDLLNHYLDNGVNCAHLHESKHREFFLCIKAFYSKVEIAYLLHPIIGESIDFKNAILQNSDHFTCINDMMNATRMGRTQFYRNFKKEFGSTAKQWLLKQQIQKIKYAAARPNVSVKELMSEFDFDGASNFTQFCKLHFGTTPTELIESLKPEKM